MNFVRSEVIQGKFIDKFQIPDQVEVYEGSYCFSHIPEEFLRGSSLTDARENCLFFEASCALSDFQIEHL